jgi:protocatechuate 3,4-dioxygenase beta subunit
LALSLLQPPEWRFIRKKQKHDLTAVSGIESRREPERGVIMRRNKAAFLQTFLMIVAAIVFISHAGAEETKEITCTGKIIDTGGGPINGAKVSFYQTVYNQAINIPESKLLSNVITGADGAFSFKVSPQSDVYRYGYIVAQKERLALGIANWLMRQDQEFELKLGQAKELAGVVVDQSDKPISGAQVSVWSLVVDEGQEQQSLDWPVSAELLTSIADHSGRFVFTNIPAEATADFIIKKNGRATINTYRSTEYPNQKMSFTPGQKDIKLVLPVEARIEGTVVAKDTGEPTGGVNLLLIKEANRPLPGQGPISTKKDGTFNIGALAPGKYTLELVRPAEKLADWVSEPVEVKTEAGQVEKNVRIELSKGGLLEVLVTEAGTNKPIEGASVSVYNERRQQSCNGRTGDDGVGRIRLLPGAYQWGHAYKTDFTSIEYRDPVTIEDDVTKRLEWQLSPLPKITGVVRDYTGKPIEGAVLAVCPMGGSRDLKSDAKGRFEVSWDPGTAVDERQTPFLVCRYIEGNLAAAAIIPEGKQTLDITLKPGVIVTGKVVDPYGRGIADARIRIMLRQTMWAATMSRESTQTDAEGNFEIKALPVEQRYELSVNANGYGSKRIEINADDAVDSRAEIGKLILPVANLAISGRIVDTQGNPIANTRIESYNYEGGQPERLFAQTDSQGKFTIDGVCEGKLDIRVNADHDGKRLSARVITNGGATGITIVAREGRPPIQNLGTKTYDHIIQSSEKAIAGVAVDEKGLPVAGVPVGVCCHKTKRENGKFSWMFSDFSDLAATTDGQGRFAIELKEDGEYNLRFSPDHHAALIVYDVPVGKKDLKVTLPEGGTVVGRLVRMDKGRKVPIPNVEVKIEQPDRASYTHLGFDRDRVTVTDAEGRFRFEHLRTKIRPHASMSQEKWEYVPRVWEILYGDTSKTIAFYDSTTIKDFELVVKPSLTDTQSLVGGALPEFDGIKIDLSADQNKDKAILVCFFDMNQRPSRNCIQQLSKRAQELKAKDVSIVAVQTSKVDEDALNEWIKGQNITFPVGMVLNDEEAIRFIWGIKSLPWLILTDREHIVRSEGFAPAELGEKLK